jgi:deoxyribodipyrimidine photo-lyase
MFPHTRTAALAQLEAFLPRAGRAYASHRNHDSGPGTPRTTSLLSPAIRRKLITEAEVCARVQAAHGYGAAEKFIQEVCWRTYWVGWLQQRPGVWTRYQSELADLQSRLDLDRAPQRRYAAAIAGETGIDAFDGWAQELTQTGWMHNHARMNFASIWLFTLKLPWQLGADFFYRHLLDACPASNTLSWRWVAGLQTAGKTYLANPDAIRQMHPRFTLDAPLARAALPLPADDPGPPRGIRAAAEPDPDKRTGLFLTTADLSLETEILPPLAAVAATSHIGGHPSPLKRQHAEAALADGLARAAAHAKADPERLDEDAPVEAVRAWAARHCLQQVISGEAAIGPEASRLAELTKALAADGIALVQVRRRWDDRAWPMANKGFFAFKAGIPKLLAL